MQRRWLVVVVGFFGGALVVWRCRNAEPTDSGDPGLAGSSRSASGHVRSQPRPDPKALGRAAIAGTVKNERGAGIAGARVCARGTAADLADEALREPWCAIADGNGAYRIANLLAAKYQVGASAKTYRPASYGERERETGVRVRARELVTGIDIVLEDGGVELTGVVLDATGGPIEKARVWENGINFAETDAKGELHLWVKPGSVWLVATADGYADNSEDIDVPKQGSMPRVEIVLTPESSISGTVVDGATSQPVAGARVIVGESDWGWDRGSETFTDERGAFRVTRLIPKRYVVVARSDSGFGRTEGSLLAGLAQNVESVVVKLWPAHRVEGRVVLAGTKQDCPDAYVSLRDPAANRSVDLRAASDGTLFAEGVLPATYEVTVGCPNVLPRDKYEPIKIGRGDGRGMIWEVDPGATLRGRITRDGAPVHAAVIVARREGGNRDRGSFGNTNALRDGSYEIRGLRAGSFTVQASSDFSAKSELVIEIAKNATVERNIALTAEPVGEIAGVVVDASGSPVAGVDVIAATRTRRGEGGRTVTTSATGAFAIAALRAGTYAVYARRDEKPLRKPGATDDSNEDTTTVKVGQTTTMRLVVEVSTKRITGTVVDATGKPIADAFVSAARESDAVGGGGSSIAATRWNWDQKPVLTSPDGRFEVDKLPSGQYTVRAYRRGGGEAIAEHVPAGSSTRLTIHATGSLEGTVRRPGGAVDDVAITIRDVTTNYRRREEFYRTAGRFIVRDLPAGKYIVVAEATGGSKQLELELREGEVRGGVDFELVDLVVLTGRIVQLGTTTPVAGFHVIPRPVRGSGMYADDPERATSDAAGRFTVHHVTPGSLMIMTWPDGDSEWTGVTTFRTVTGSGTIDIGDIAVMKRRLKPAETAGDIGLRYRYQPPDTPPDQRETRVSYIDPKGPAVKSGIEVDDVIVSVDGLDIRGENGGRMKALVTAPPGTRLALGLARGVTVYITLAAP